MQYFAKSALVLGLAAFSSAAFTQMRYHDPLVGRDLRKSLWKGKIKRANYRGSSGKAIVFYDTTGSFGWAGDLYSQQLANLLTHFDMNVTLQPIEGYKAGMLKQNDIGFYLGFVYDNPLPAAFKADVLATKNPFCWAGFNIWQVAWTNGTYRAHDPAFVSRTGMQFMGLDDSGYPQVQYKGITLVKEQNAYVEGAVQIVDPALATAVAMSTDTDGTSTPYITKGGSKFWYVADNPMMDYSLRTMQDRMLAFSDSIHDMIGDKVKEKHRAFVRIEDVSPFANPDQLRALADVLDQENVPFEVMVIPEFMDPNGTYSGGVPTDIPMTKAPEFVKALRYMERKGGQIVMHGVTHQYSNVGNPYTGVSGEDFEFFRIGFNDAGAMTMIGPVPEDSATWVKNRINYGQRLLAMSGFFPSGWNTPHYTASSIDYDEFANDFDYSLCRSLTFTTLPDGTMSYLTQFSPFTYTDDHGMFRIPETLGYIDPTGTGGWGPSDPSVLQARAHANLAVRDGWAGFYFHWFLSPETLRDTVQRVKSEGYKFVPTSKWVDWFW